MHLLMKLLEGGIIAQVGGMFYDWIVLGLGGVVDTLALGLGLLLLFGYIYLDWRLFRTRRDLIHQGKKLKLSGRRAYYLIGAFVLAFGGITAFLYGLFGLNPFAGYILCWLIPAMVVAVIATLRIDQRLIDFRFGTAAD